MKITYNRRKLVSCIKVQMFNQMHYSKTKIGQRDFAKQIGISVSTFNRVYNGKMPDLITHFKLCKWLNMPFESFVISK